jgi:hypothetical protein
MRPTVSPEELERRRWRAVELLTQGHPPAASCSQSPSWWSYSQSAHVFGA